MFPAGVTGVTADSWNVTGDVARGVVSRRKGKRERNIYIYIFTILN